VLACAYLHLSPQHREKVVIVRKSRD